MSKIGLNPITIEEGVEVTINGKEVTAKGPKGELKVTVPFKINVEVKDNQILLTRKDEMKQSKALHGTFRALVANIVNGVKNGYSKKLEVVGVGYRVRLDGTALVMNLGLNHPITMTPPEGITLDVPDETTIVVNGVDKQLVGEYAAKIRETKKPEPYKGKGIRYEGEYVRRKSAKASVAAK
ncbi:MAG: 50S ribosomal protein L6 [candidate division WS6 bacterium GW2011_GWF2_39_15]|uniref:Large ribosomal subunit protein uL6 n=1 Tax=candidate division WS6 bacterium GW2011_GWF2_39_15 TaxID=1619100 RepID=A0A0G0Q5H2_9BACT|nr:MAG: 50S ribosomal protein L6 [candidate division WS6 bacterium GW2011_GWF2_39_15]